MAESTWRSGAILCFLAGVIFWAVRYPYLGLEHDAVLYALQVARHLDPAAYRLDLFFEFGSQDDFSLFASLFAPLVRNLGLDTASRMVLLAGGALWVFSCLCLTRAAMGRHWLALFAALLLVTTTLNYSLNQDSFKVFEHFLTARSFAFSFSLLALALALRGANLPSIVVLLVAMLLHPLISVWAALLLVAVRLRDRWLVLATLLSVVVVFAAPVVSSAEVFQLMDEHWASIVKATSKDVFAGGWGELRLISILFWIGLLWLGGRHGSATLRRWYLVMSMIVAWAVLVSILASHHRPIQIVMQIQPWRALWLAQILGLVVLADLLYQTLAKKFLFAAALAFAAVLMAFDLLESLWPYLVGAGLYFERSRDIGGRALAWMETNPKAAMGFLGVLLALLFPGYLMALELLGNSLSARWGNDYSALRGFFLLGGGGVFILILARGLVDRRAIWVVVPLLAVGGVAAAMSWDHRNAARLHAERQYLSSPPDARIDGWMERVEMRRGDVVAWAGHDLTTWFVLRTAYYGAARDTMSPAPHAVGLVLSRARKNEVVRRFERLERASVAERDGARGGANETLGAMKGDPHDMHRYSPQQISAAGIAVLCADPILSWVISTVPVFNHQPGVRLPFELSADEQYLHRCTRP